MEQHLAQQMEDRRQRTIQDYQLDSTEPEPEFDAVTELAADLFGVPISAVTVLGRDRQLLRGVCGLDQRSTARSDAFCNLTVAKDDVFVVEDALADPRFRENRLVTGEPYIRFYAGAPLKIGDGVAIGSLCIIDRQPRELGAAERRRLKLVARTVADIIELRLGSRLADQRQQEIERHAELLRATVDHVRQGIGVFDSDLRLALWNDQLFDLLGLDRSLCEEGCDAERLLTAAANNGAFGAGDTGEIVAALMHSVRTRPSNQMELKGAGGRTLHAWRAAIPGGRAILTVEDITEQRRAAKMKDEFVSTVSHELRTPLTSIRGALAVLGRKAAGALDPQSIQMLSMASKNAERLTALINDILDIEKLGSGTLAMRRDSVDLVQVLRDSCDQNRPFAETHGVSLSLDVPEEPLRVEGDHGRLLQAVTNLLSNACKFSPAGSTVRLEGKAENGAAYVTVRDDGSGIPDEFRPQIFRRFAQADPTRKSGIVGTGLGLAITKAIVEKHQGEIGFTSELGQGTCFWIRIPLMKKKDVQ